MAIWSVKSEMLLLKYCFFFPSRNLPSHIHLTLKQNLNSQLNEMVGEYEQKYGEVDRSEFDGEIVVPAHLRNISMASLRSSRIHGSLFGSLSRSRTFLNIPGNARHTFHGSVPDLARHSFSFVSRNNAEPIDRRLSSTSGVTKITLNPSTKLAITIEDATAPSTNDDGDTSEVTLRPKRSMQPPDQISRNLHRSSQPIANHSRVLNTKISHSKNHNNNNNNNNINNNTIPPKQMNEIIPSGYRSLDRPIRALKPIVQPPKLSDVRSNSESYNSEGYMTLIQTNVNKTKMSNVTATEEAPLATRTSTFQCQSPSTPTTTNSSGFAGDITLDQMQSFKLPRVSLGPVTKQQPK